MSLREAGREGGFIAKAFPLTFFAWNLKLSEGVWGVTDRAATIPAGATSVYLNGISCTATSACTAVGSYYNGSESLALAERYNGSTWTVQSTPAVSTGSLSAVSCASATLCTAVGKYYAGESKYKTLVESWNGSAWSLQSSPNPEGKPFSGFSAISCSAATACSAVGSARPGFSLANPVTLAQRYE